MKAGLNNVILFQMKRGPRRRSGRAARRGLRSVWSRFFAGRPASSRVAGQEWCRPCLAVQAKDPRPEGRSHRPYSGSEGFFVPFSAGTLATATLQSFIGRQRIPVPQKFQSCCCRVFWLVGCLLQRKALVRNNAVCVADLSRKRRCE